MASYLDTGHLQIVNGVRDTVLELVFNSRCTQEEEIFLNKFSGFIKCFTATIDGCSRLIIDGDPLLVFLLGDISTSNAERAKTVSGVFLWHTVSAIQASI